VCTYVVMAIVKKAGASGFHARLFASLNPVLVRGQTIGRIAGCAVAKR
jgi:hypothetical protein